jgi:hypothetical protein
VPVPPCHPCAETEGGLLPFEGVLHFGGAQRWWRTPSILLNTMNVATPKRDAPERFSDVFMSVNEI